MSGKVISGPAAVLIIAFFFFPWILVSCEGMAIGEFSGYQLAAGVPPESMGGLVSAEDMAGEPILFAVPLAGIISLILLGITLWKADFEQNAAWGQIILAAAALLILLLEWWQWQQKSDPMLEITIRPALWMSFIALLALIAGAVIDLILWRRARPSSPAAPSAHLPRQSFSSPTPLPPKKPYPNDSFPNVIPPGKATIVDDNLPEMPGVGQETIVEEDLSRLPGAGQETIVEEPQPDISGAGQATIVEDDLLTRGLEGSGGASSVKTEVLYFEPEPLAQLVIDEGESPGKQFDLYGDVSIGRVPENDIIIDDTAMSSYHARITEENGRFTILDLNSTNGVYLSSAGQSRWQKQNSYELHNGDRIKLGRTILRFNIQG